MRFFHLLSLQFWIKSLTNSTNISYLKNGLILSNLLKEFPEMDSEK